MGAAQVVISLDPPFYVATWTATATMTGAAKCLPATGATVPFSGTTACRFRDGLISEYRQTYDALDFQQQLGVLPKAAGLGFKGRGDGQPHVRPRQKGLRR